MLPLIRWTCLQFIPAGRQRQHFEWRNLCVQDRGERSSRQRGRPSDPRQNNRGMCVLLCNASCKWEGGGGTTDVMTVCTIKREKHQRITPSLCMFELWAQAERNAWRMEPELAFWPFVGAPESQSCRRWTSLIRFYQSTLAMSSRASLQIGRDKPEARLSVFTVAGW